jgi:hypothetical protein
VIIATTPSTQEQRIDVQRAPALQLPAGADPKTYYAEQLKDANTPFYRAALSMAQMSMRGNLVRIVAPTQVIANSIALCVSSLAKIIQQASPVKTPVPATATVAQPTATYSTDTPANSDIALPADDTAPRYAAQKPFEGEGIELGRGYFAEQCENGSFNIWFGTGALNALANVPDIETARQVVEGTYKKARGRMVEGHFTPDDTFLVAMSAMVGQLTLQAC